MARRLGKPQHKPRYSSIAEHIIWQQRYLFEALENGELFPETVADQVDLIAADATTTMALTRDLEDSELENYQRALDALNT